MDLYDIMSYNLNTGRITKTINQKNNKKRKNIKKKNINNNKRQFKVEWEEDYDWFLLRYKILWNWIFVILLTKSVCFSLLFQKPNVFVIWSLIFGVSYLFIRKSTFQLYNKVIKDQKILFGLKKKRKRKRKFDFIIFSILG